MQKFKGRMTLKTKHFTSYFYHKIVVIMCLFVFVFMLNDPIIQSFAEVTTENNPPPIPANFSPERITELQSWLKKSLSIVEIDRELDKIKALQINNTAELALIQRDINLQSFKLKDLREKAGKILRSYYMGSRQPIWMMILSIKKVNWSDWLSVFDYMQLIVKHDQVTLDNYSKAFQQLEATKRIGVAKAVALDEEKHRYDVQRARVLALTASLEKELSRQKDAKLYWAWLKAKNEQWLHIGLPQFEAALDGLSKAMTKFNRMIGPDTLTTTSSGTIFHIHESVFNKFIKEESPELRDMRFAFDDDAFRVNGVAQGVPIRFAGNYRITNTPNHGIRFFIERIEYGGVDLPDTTLADLQSRFDLGFYPASIGWNITITSVGQKNRELVVDLKF